MNLEQAIEIVKRENDLFKSFLDLHNCPTARTVRATDKLIVAAKVLLERERGCEHCRGAKYTGEPFEVKTQMGLIKRVQFNFCPVCGRLLEAEE